jgi:hypothetical protein
VGGLAEVVADRLVGSGWVVRDLQQRYGLTLTRAGAGGVLVAVQLRPVAITGLRPSPERLRVGAGHGPALDLMPLLTLRARPILVEAYAGTVTATGEVDAAVAAVRTHAAELTARFPDPDLLLEAVSGRDRLVLLAALGRTEAVRELLADRPPEDRRFRRQLHRRLAQGLPPAPPDERTLAVVAPAGEPPPDRGARWATARARTRARRAAQGAARRAAPGRTRAQVEALVAAEFRARGLEVDPAQVAVLTTMIELRQRPLGAARAAVAGTVLGGRAIRDLVRTVRGAGRAADTDPPWLRPPERAVYRVPTRHRYVAVHLDAAGRARVRRVAAAGTRRIGPFVLLDAWLTRDPAGRVTVHIGPDPVGTVAVGYDLAFTAAELFDEDPVLAARLLPDPQPLLELPLPRP